MTNAEVRFNKSLRPRKPEVSLGRTAQDVHLDSYTAPELRVCAERMQDYHDDVELNNVLGCRVDILGTICDQYVSMV